MNYRYKLKKSLSQGIRFFSLILYLLVLKALLVVLVIYRDQRTTPWFPDMSQVNICLFKILQFLFSPYNMLNGKNGRTRLESLLVLATTQLLQSASGCEANVPQLPHICIYPDISQPPWAELWVCVCINQFLNRSCKTQFIVKRAAVARLRQVILISQLACTPAHMMCECTARTLSWLAYYTV